MKKGVFIVIDGLGGTGKTTQIEALKKRLGGHALFTNEPGGAPRAERIRDILKSGSGPQSDPLTDFFLFWAARAEHVGKRIAPALRRGKMIICDRFDSSTYAMQVVGEKRNDFKKLFWQCRARVLKGAIPDAYIILDTPPALARTRQSGRRRGEDRFDARALSYQMRVRQGYRDFARQVGKHAHVLDARASLEQVSSEIWTIVQRVSRGR